MRRSPRMACDTAASASRHGVARLNLRPEEIGDLRVAGAARMEAVARDILGMAGKLAGEEVHQRIAMRGDIGGNSRVPLLRHRANPRLIGILEACAQPL